MKDFINVGLLGAGTVGGGVLQVLEKNADKIAKEVGKPVKITKVLDRNVEARQKEYGDQYYFTADANEVLNDPEIDIVVELLGREHPAKEYIAQAFANGKHVVTANKDVLARYGAELFPLAEEHGCDFMFEASVCGGIPIIGPMKTSMAGNKINSIMGIVNGTTNYMLSKMADEHLDYDEVLKDAQEKGYAESDPTADVGGLDAARKVVILASIAFNTRFSLDDVKVEGIENVEACDIKYASSLGYAVKLLGIAKNDTENGVTLRVTPTMIPLGHPLAGVNGVYNAVFVNGDAIGEAMFLGLGRLQALSAVISLILHATCSISLPVASTAPALKRRSCARRKKCLLLLIFVCRLLISRALWLPSLQPSVRRTSACVMLSRRTMCCRARQKSLLLRTAFPRLICRWRCKFCLCCLSLKKSAA